MAGKNEGYSSLETAPAACPFGRRGTQGYLEKSGGQTGMTVQEAIEYINAHTWSQWKLGLSRTEDLLRLLGGPQKRLRFVHVAGSNGKGSTCAMIERILREAGYRTGFYPSPYIEDFRERIQVCGEYIPEDALARITARVRDLAETMEDHPTQFELITAIGMVWFAEQKCDLVVLEVGLGGTFDSTNVIDAPEAAVITRIGLEHTEYLGSTLAEIAGNKCGIIKPGSDVICYENEPEVMEVVRRTCAEKKCPLHIARFSRVELLSRSLEGQEFRFLPEPVPEMQMDHGGSGLKSEGPSAWSAAQEEPFRLALTGEYQLHNAATALTVVEALRGRGFDIPQEAVRRGLALVTWPARFEVLSRRPLLILDGGHNPQCAEALTESLRTYLPGKKIFFLLGMLRDKDYGAVIDLLLPFAAGFVCLTPDSPRALPAEELAQVLTERGIPAQACGTPQEGIRLALEQAQGLPVVAFGSLYMAGAIRQVYREEIRMRKDDWRTRATRGRRALTDRERAQKNEQICLNLSGLPELKSARTVFTYAASWDEADPGMLIRSLAEEGKTICYPACGEAGHMDAVIPTPGDPLAWRTGPFGIREPDPARAQPVDPAEIDVVLVPCVVFDRHGGRCGHGAGYYDRYLAKLPPEIPKILLAFDAQEADEVVMERTDIPMDLAVTESSVYRFGTRRVRLSRKAEGTF